MEKIRDNKGITLIVLIITIIVLLIISGVLISGAINGINESGENRLIAELEKVQHAITQRYSKYELTKDASILVGTKVDLSSLTDVPESINWKVFQVTQASETSTHPERKYYRLGKSDLENLGLTGEHKSSSYIVNYYSGEVYDETERQTTSGTVLYKSAIEELKSEVLDEIVLNGLVAYYDATNNTGTGHSSSTTTWKDLSGNNRDGTLKNVTLGSNYAEFNGTNSWVDLGEINSFTNQVTLEATINIPLSAQDNIGDIICNQHTGGVCLRCKKGYISFVVYLKNVGYAVANCSNDILFNTTNHVVGIYNGLEMKIYINGIEQEEVTLCDGDYNPSPNILDNPGTIKGPKYNTVMALGVNPKGNAIEMLPFKGKIYSARIYNRALSASEVKQNYIIEKNRYGIEE